MKHGSIVVVGLLAALSCSQVVADYTVQIGSMSRSYSGFSDKAEGIGEVMTRMDTNGRTVYQVGNFPTRESARGVLDKLRRAGYADAFVRRLSGHDQVRSAMGHAHGKAGQAHDLSHLPESVRADVVYLDGSLHVKEGDRFIPLAEYQQ